MGIEKDFLEIGGGLAAGALLGHLATPASLRRALYATGNSNSADRVARVLDTERIAHTVTAPTIDLNTVRVIGAGTTLYVVIVSQGDFEKAQALIAGL